MYFKAITSVLASFLIMMGCVYLYQRETSVIQNQTLLASEIVAIKAERDQVNKQLEGFLNGLNGRLTGLESLASAEPNKK